MLAVAVLAAASPARAANDETPPVPDRRAEPPQLERLFDELAAPRLPTPFSLPELSHADFDASLSWTVGAAAPTDPSRGASNIGIVRGSGEARIGPLRRVYVGATCPLALGLPVTGTGGNKVLVGNAEAHVRVVFPMPSWLALGAAFGVTAPTAGFSPKGGSEEAALAAASLEPTELVDFMPGILALRPSIDLRLLRGPFIFQLRDGVDVVVDSVEAPRARTLGRLNAHVGVLATPELELSVEASQVYFLATDVPDDKRSALTVGPGVTWALGSVDVGVGAVTNVFSPLADGMDRFLAARVALVSHFK
jgi:hypothetical protein